MIVEILIGTGIAISVLAGVYVFWKKSSGIAEFSKRVQEGKSMVTVKANKDLRKITLVEVHENEEIMLVRDNVAKNETVEFVYPFSLEKAQLTIQDENSDHYFEVPVI
jgi:hypothetical protein